MESAPSRRGWAWITTGSNGGRRQSGRHGGRGLSPLLDSSNCPSLGSLGQGPNCTVELARGEGAKMTIRWEGKEGLDLVGLVEAFWRSGP
jgi:hypothetical protein